MRKKPVSSRKQEETGLHGGRYEKKAHSIKISYAKEVTQEPSVKEMCGAVRGRLRRRRCDISIVW